MQVRYMSLIVKGRANAAMQAAEAHKVTAHMHQEVEGATPEAALTILHADDKYSNAIQEWLLLDDSKPPYPTGSLLFYSIPE